MNYNKRALEDLYGKVSGNVPPHEHLIVNEGTAEEHNIADRNDIGFKDKDGIWRFKRASDGFIKNIMVPEMAYAESGSYMKAILKRAKASGIVDESETINSAKVKTIYNYVAAAAKKKNKLSQLIKNLGSTAAQDNFKETLNISNTQINNLFNLVNKTYGSDFTPDKKVIEMRPAGDEAKTRGAAGPGEALFAFLLRGSKPVVGDLVLDNDIIELKKNGGRIGKNLNLEGIKSLSKKFNQVRGGRGGLPVLNGFTEDELRLPLGNIIDKYSGTKETIGTNGVFGIKFGDWLKSNTRAAAVSTGNSTYTTLVQYIAILQLRQYIKDVLEPQNTKSIVVFDPNLNYAGFELKDIMNTSDVHQLLNKLRKKNIYFAPKLDGDGYQIYISSTELQQL